MKVISRFLAVAGLAALAIYATASKGHGENRTFRYTSADTVSGDFSGSGDLNHKTRTVIKVNPYLYIHGNLGAVWTVEGWGIGVDTKVESIRFFHNETLTLDLEQFATLTKISGTKTGAQAMDLEGQLRFINDQNGTDLYDSGMVEIARLNDIFNPSGPNFEVGYTGGLLRLDFGRKISIRPEVGPGTYENVGLIKVIRN